MKLGLLFLSFILGMVVGVTKESSSLAENILSSNQDHGNFKNSSSSLIDIRTLGNILKKSSSTKSFVEALSEVDPSKIRDIIVLLEKLAADSLSEKGVLETAVFDAETVLAAADSSLNHASQAVVGAINDVKDSASKLSNAEANLAQAKVVHSDTEAVLVDKETEATTAKSNRETAQTAKDAADKVLEEQGPGYDDERAIILQVIEMLKELIEIGNPDKDCDVLLNAYDGNSCFTRYKDYSSAAVVFQKSHSMSGGDETWRGCFADGDSRKYTCHMDGGKVGDYFTMIFSEKQTFYGFRVNCGQEGGSNLQNIFDIKYYDDATSTWVTVGSTNSADKYCDGSPSYAEWKKSYRAKKWQFVLTEQTAGPYYWGFAWYIAA